MNQQEEDTVKFFQEHMEKERCQAEGTASSTAAVSSSPMGTATANIIDGNHITRRPAQVHCNLGFEDLTVLSELRVDFNNIAANGFDLREEMTFQGWENYFARLHGPVYEHLVKDFWKQADWDSYHVVSHVLGKRIIITEKSIAQLLGLTHLAGRRIYGKENKGSFVRKTIDKELFSNFDPQKKEYKVKTLFPKLRIWHRE